MTAFVILLAGAGTRMGRAGEHLHKALLPLDGRAVISRQIALAPPGARLIACTGYRAGQLRDYLDLAHPDLQVTYVPVPGWDAPGGGPGASLLAARDEIGDDDLVFASCDTLWEADETLWDTRTSGSWAAVAPVPAGTAPERWRRISYSAVTGAVHEIFGKSPVPASDWAYTGLSMIVRRDLPAFWAGIEGSGLSGGERHYMGGLAALARYRWLDARQVTWTDTGDEASYARAIAACGYDWAKPGEVTWVLPETGRVVRFRSGYDWFDTGWFSRRAGRQACIADATPRLTGIRPHLLARAYVPGVTGYEAAADDAGLVPRLLDWASEQLWRPVPAGNLTQALACHRFYRDKTRERVTALQSGLRGPAERALARVDWDELTCGCEPVTFHGDFNLGNVIVRPDGTFTAIDWREDFAGEAGWGDRRYDLAKLAAGMAVHWGNARRGDSAPWPAGRAYLAAMASWLGGTIPHDVRVIAAVSLLNCAPLHAAPLDAVLVARGTALLEELT